VRQTMSKGILFATAHHEDQYFMAKDYVWHAAYMAAAHNDPLLNSDTSICLLRTACSFLWIDSTRPGANEIGSSAATRNSSKHSGVIATGVAIERSR